jgi:hypothetical protein
MSVLAKSTFKKYLTVLFCVITVTVLRADGNACCGCHSGGCSNSWQCVGVVLGEISACCGLEEGSVDCREDSGQFCTTCADFGKQCGDCEPREDGE